MTESAVEDDRVQDDGGSERPGETLVARPPWWALASFLIVLPLVPFIGVRVEAPPLVLAIVLVVVLLVGVAVTGRMTATITPDALDVRAVVRTVRLPWAAIDDRAVTPGWPILFVQRGAFAGSALSLRVPDRRSLPVVATIGRDYDDPFLWAVLVRLHRERPLTVSILAPGRYRVSSGSRLPDGTSFQARRAWPNPVEYRVTIDGVEHPVTVNGDTARQMINDAIVPRLQRLLDEAVAGDREAVTP